MNYIKIYRCDKCFRNAAFIILLVAFVRAIENGRMARYIEEYVSEALSSVLSDFHNGIDVFAIKK